MVRTAGGVAALGWSASDQVRAYIESPIAFWERCAQLGRVVELDFGSLGAVILFAEPESIRHIFRLPADAFTCAPFNEHYRYVMGGLSVLLQDGDVHKRQRRMLSPAFRADRLAAKAPAILSLFGSRMSDWPLGQPFNPRPAFHRAAYALIVELLFADLESSISKQLIEAHQQSVAGQVGAWGPWRAFSRLQPALREALTVEIETRRAAPDTPGFFTQVVLAQDADGEPLALDECQDHVFSLLVAGVDTSAILLSWALHWLSRSPEVLSRLTAEVRGASADGVLALPYLQAVLSETLRMYPIVPTPTGRKLTREAEIGGRTYPAGTTLLPCPYLVHRDPDIYPEPSGFRPERFLDRKPAAGEYFPFGGGLRTCVGEMLAQVEFKTVLCAILREWDLESGLEENLTPVRHGTLLAPPDELRVTVRSRETSA